MTLTNRGGCVLKQLIMSSALVLTFYVANANADTQGVVQCKDINFKEYGVEPKTITIVNNSHEKTIFPVVQTSSNEVNEWMQACFRDQTKNYTTSKAYFLYINGRAGLAPGASVTVSLPVYSEVSYSFEKKEEGKPSEMIPIHENITWWNGGRVLIATQYPGDMVERQADNLLTLTPKGVTCTGSCTGAPLLYASSTVFSENVPAQLTEYTFGNVNPPAGETVKLLAPFIVGYNVSYVDHVYLPIAMTPANNRYIGYTGSTLQITDFRSKLNHFLEHGSVGEGWPIYNMQELKLPGAYNVFAQRGGHLSLKSDAPVRVDNAEPNVLTILKCKEGNCSAAEKKSLEFGKSVQKMQNLFAFCLKGDFALYGEEGVPKECAGDIGNKLMAINGFFDANFANYKKLINRKYFKPWTAFEAIKHIYGWVPFNEGLGADGNKLDGNTPESRDTHFKMQTTYITGLQYNYRGSNTPKDQLFNPYVQLIHSAEYLDMNSYAFSVDDAVGFMSELGTGIIISVGGDKGLENKEQFSWKNGFVINLGVASKYAEDSAHQFVTHYGACKMPCDKVNEDIIMPAWNLSGFRIGTTEYPVKVGFTDIKGNRYSFIIKNSIANVETEDKSGIKYPKEYSDIMNLDTCHVYTESGEEHEKSKQWCQSFTPHAKTDPMDTKNPYLIKNFISFSEIVPDLK